MIRNEVIVEWMPGKSFVRTRALTRFDYGQILKIIGEEVPAEYEVEFALHKCGTVAEMAEGNPAGIEVPERILAASTKSIFARIVKKDGISRKVLLEIEIPVTDSPTVETRNKPEPKERKSR